LHDIGKLLIDRLNLFIPHHAGLLDHGCRRVRRELLMGSITKAGGDLAASGDCPPALDAIRCTIGRERRFPLAHLLYLWMASGHLEDMPSAHRVGLCCAARRHEHSLEAWHNDSRR